MINESLSTLVNLPDDATAAEIDAAMVVAADDGITVQSIRYSKTEDHPAFWGAFVHIGEVCQVSECGKDWTRSGAIRNAAVKCVADATGECDGCGSRVPVDELQHRFSSSGETDQCEECLTP